MDKKTFSESEKEAINKAESLGQNATEKDRNNLEKTLPKMNRSIVHKVWDKVQFLYDTYKKAELPVNLQISVIGALLYLILPIDVFPDLVPFIGFLDDVAVVLFIYKKVAGYAVPKLIEKKVQEIEESKYSEIDKKLNDIFRQNIILSIFTFLINLTGLIMLILKPFGIELSRMLSISMFSIALIISVAFLINNIQKYGSITIYNLKIVIKEKSLKNGIRKAVLNKYPEITKAYAKIDLARHFVPGLDAVPQLDDIIKDFVQHYKKNAILFCSLIFVYSVSLLVVRTIFLFKMN